MNAVFIMALGFTFIGLLLGFILGYVIGKQAKATEIYKAITDETKVFTSPELRKLYYENKWPKSAEEFEKEYLNEWSKPEEKP